MTAYFHDLPSSKEIFYSAENNVAAEKAPFNN
jgi:hypothetical protein